MDLKGRPGRWGSEGRSDGRICYHTLNVLITKLRSSNNVETQQYRKATKALVVLIPLLGITYILFVVGPTEGDWANSFAYFRALLLSTQGLTVALFYCFLNTEVQNTVRHHFSRWKESRDIGHRRYTYSKDWSPNTRTESIRLCSKHEVAPYKKRESTVSESTTLTLVGYGGGKRRLSREGLRSSERLASAAALLVRSSLKNIRLTT
ncbi:hypothetical protein GE061_015710 [Apolygus lucorum]|uniref:G-protein coupled receptors family 2 profile 2 domain-containing protein n=1 Tax=Apolygus lucorum TaxID=248454 RepID=A0A8S9XQU7_APOLU|nr:hypothetical protein GE061_015710 [Apolygus lucorum]